MRIIVVVVAQTRDYENACFTIDHFAPDDPSVVESVITAVKAAESSDDSCDEDSQSSRKRVHDGTESATCKKPK